MSGFSDMGYHELHQPLGQGRVAAVLITLPDQTGGAPGPSLSGTGERSYSTTFRLVSAVASELPPTQIVYVVGSTVGLASTL